MDIDKINIKKLQKSIAKDFSVMGVEDINEAENNDEKEKQSLINSIAKSLKKDGDESFKNSLKSKSKEELLSTFSTLSDLKISESVLNLIHSY